MSKFLARVFEEVLMLRENIINYLKYGNIGMLCPKKFDAIKYQFMIAFSAKLGKISC